MTSDLQLPKINQIKDSSKQKVVVCRGRSCRKYAAEKVFINFKQNLPVDVELIAVPCLGQCGNGAMVVVEPDRVWYYQVSPQEVAQIIEQHILGNCPVREMLYPKFHSS